MNWKGFEGISRSLHEGTVMASWNGWKTTKKSVRIPTVACDWTKYIPNASQNFYHYSRLFAASLLWQQKV